MKKSRFLLMVAVFLAGFVFFFTQHVRAEEAAMMNSEVTSDDAAMKEVAMDGNCAVCMLSGMEMAGKDEFTTEYEGKTYKFESEEHKALFLADPAKYAQKAEATEGGPSGVEESK